MKARSIVLGLIVFAAALVLILQWAGSVQAKPPVQAAGDAVRWHIITNPGDSSKTFLIDTLVGETYIYSSSGDSFSWKKMERGK